jgi:23S rRNA (pseudouridine1915-N3)-methyltransferase
MIKIKIYSVGKTKEIWLQAALDLYETRLKPCISFEWILTKTNEQLKQFLEKEANFICLDSTGKQYSSEEFSAFFTKSIRETHSRLSFIIGDAKGIPISVKTKAKSLLSLSRLTFTHQITRLILMEQIYRAIEIEKGSSYHKR